MKHTAQAVLLVFIGVALIISIFIDASDGVVYSFDKANWQLELIDIKDGKLRYFLNIIVKLILSIVLVLGGFWSISDNQK